MRKNNNTTASEADAVVKKVETQKVEGTVNDTAKVKTAETTDKVEQIANDTEFVEVEFLVSPTEKFLLAYSVGEVGFIPAEQATELIELGYAKKAE